MSRTRLLRARTLASLLAVFSVTIAHSAAADEPSEELSRQSPVSKGLIHITFAKYKPDILEQQYFGCPQGAPCSGCMKTNFPAPFLLNPFTDGYGSSCEGTWGYVGPKIVSFFTDEWVVINVFSDKQTLQATVDTCGQNFDWDLNDEIDQDLFCEFFVPRCCIVRVPGAYIVGTEIELGQLDEEINRNATGDNGAPALDQNWLDFQRYVRQVHAEQSELDDWEIVANASSIMMADTWFHAPPAKATVDFARKCFAHAFVASQSWEFHYLGYVLEGIGIDPFPLDPDRTPSFLWQMHHALADYGILDVPVNSRAETWGSVKSRFDGR